MTSARPSRIVVERLADRHVGGRAGRALRPERAARAELHRDPGGAHVRDDRGDRERVDPIGAALRAAGRSSPGTALRPPIPVATETPDALGLRLDLDPGVGLRHAGGRDDHLREAVDASAPCGARSSRWARSPLSSQAKWTAKSEGSNCWIGAAPLLPAVRFAQKVSASFPSGVTSADSGHDNPPASVRAHADPPYIPRPPSTSSTSPVMNAASSEQRKRTARATSSGSPRRPSGGVREDEPAHLLGRHVGQRGLDVAGRDQRSRARRGTELARERLREADDPRLRRRVVRLARIAVRRRRSRTMFTIDPARRFSIFRATARHGVERAARGSSSMTVSPVLVAHPRDAACRA